MQNWFFIRLLGFGRSVIACLLLEVRTSGSILTVGQHFFLLAIKRCNVQCVIRCQVFMAVILHFALCRMTNWPAMSDLSKVLTAGVWQHSLWPLRLFNAVAIQNWGHSSSHSPNLTSQDGKSDGRDFCRLLGDGGQDSEDEAVKWRWRNLSDRTNVTNNSRRRCVILTGDAAQSLAGLSRDLLWAFQFQPWVT